MSTECLQHTRRSRINEVISRTRYDASDSKTPLTEKLPLDEDRLKLQTAGGADERMVMEEYCTRLSNSETFQKKDFAEPDRRKQVDQQDLDTLIENWIEQIESCIASHNGTCSLILPLEEDESIQVHVDCIIKERLKEDLEKLDPIAGWRIEMHPAQRNSARLLMNAGSPNSENEDLIVHQIAPCEVILCKSANNEFTGPSVSTTIFFKDRNGPSHYSLFPFHLFGGRNSIELLQIDALSEYRMNCIWDDEKLRSETDIKWLMTELNKLLTSGSIFLQLKHQAFGDSIVRITQIMAADFNRTTCSMDAYDNGQAARMFTDSVIGKLSALDLSELARSSSGSCVDLLSLANNNLPDLKLRTVDPINDLSTLKSRLREWRRDGSKFITNKAQFDIPLYCCPRYSTRIGGQGYFLPAVFITSPKGLFEHGHSGLPLYRRSINADTIEAVAFLSSDIELTVETKSGEEQRVVCIFPTISAQFLNPVIDNSAGIQPPNFSDVILP